MKIIDSYLHLFYVTIPSITKSVDNGKTPDVLRTRANGSKSEQISNKFSDVFDKIEHLNASPSFKTHVVFAKVHKAASTTIQNILFR